MDKTGEEIAVQTAWWVPETWPNEYGLICVCTGPKHADWSSKPLSVCACVRVCLCMCVHTCVYWASWHWCRNNVWEQQVIQGKKLLQKWIPVGFVANFFPFLLFPFTDPRGVISVTLTKTFCGLLTGRSWLTISIFFFSHELSKARDFGW